MSNNTPNTTLGREGDVLSAGMAPAAIRPDRLTESVTIFLADRKYERPRPFYCPTCGKRAFDLYSPVRLIVDGAVLSRDHGEAAGVVTQCRTCKTKLTIL